MERRFSDFFTNDTAQKCGFLESSGNEDPIITGIEYDSRNVKKGNIFFALQGLHTDGNLYIDDAVKRGASVIFHENEKEEKMNGILYIKVKNARYAMSPVSDAFYDYPSRRLLVTGVTGTEGKSSTVYFIWQLLTLMGKKAGFFSTVQQCTGKEVSWNSEHQTTPEAPVVQKLLREMADNGCDFAVVEASSHGLSEKTNRLGDVCFFSAVLTNLTHDHLEFHGTWEQYRHDKANLFRSLDKYKKNKDTSALSPFGVINADDKSLQYFSDASKQRIYKFSASGAEADINVKIIESGAEGNIYSALIGESNEQLEIIDNLSGEYNCKNVMAALLTVSGLLNTPLKEIIPLIKMLKPVRGRMNSINRGQPFEVIVDFAHTPSSFESIFPPLRSRLNKTGGKIISLFGSAGERDIQKRPEQGKIAANYSDFIILTDEDPRSENPMDILEEIAFGFEKPEDVTSTDYEKSEYVTSAAVTFIREKNLFLIPDRCSAIRKALTLACPKDLVILLGKGHENSIIYADRVMPFDEIAETEKALGEMGYQLH